MKNLSAEAIKRCKIAKDVLLLLEGHKIKAQSGYYIRSGPQISFSPAPSAPPWAPFCEVCGIGALVVAALHEQFPPDIAGNEASRVLKILEPYFDFRQLALIEAAFEGNEYGENIRATLFSMSASAEDYDAEDYDRYYDDNDEFIRARRMFIEPGSVVDDYNKILTEIMENIIHHDGEFVVGD
jgi:hypothetical protein